MPAKHQGLYQTGLLCNPLENPRYFGYGRNVFDNCGKNRHHRSSMMAYELLFPP
jgi:hypothetical protein